MDEVGRPAGAGGFGMDGLICTAMAGVKAAVANENVKNSTVGKIS
jgi:hypothetical protein